MKNSARGSRLKRGIAGIALAGAALLGGALGGVSADRLVTNFDRIVSLRPEVVKVDRSILTRAVGDDAKARRMLPSIIELLHEAGAQVAIEGIEGAAEALVAIESGADLLQGFHFAAPSANLPDEHLTDGIMAELLRMRGAPRLAVVV